MAELLWPLGKHHSGLRVVVRRELAERRERETFSGGVNMSAQYRNAQALKREMERVYMMKPNGPILCSPAVFALLKATIRPTTSRR